MCYDGYNGINATPFTIICTGVIETNQVSFFSSSFMAATPTFTLIGDTRGGPPTTYTWTKDGVEITNSSSVSISLSLNTVLVEPPTDENRAACLASLYRSTLTVTGVFPGVYQYSVSNRATTTPRTSSCYVEGITLIH
jgi:hypothetical protein